VKRDWDALRGYDASGAPSADEGEAFGSSKRDGKRRKALIDPEDDNDSGIGEGGSMSGTPKRTKKKRKVDGALTTKAPATLAPKPQALTSSKLNGRKGARKPARGREVGGGKVGTKEWTIPYPNIGVPPVLPSGTPNSQSVSYLFSKGGSHTSAGPSPKDSKDYDSKFESIWSDIAHLAVPYAYQARANHVAAVKMVHERVSKWCSSAAKRGWGGEYNPNIRKESKEKDFAGGRFGRDPVSKNRKLQRELLTFWKKNEKEERDERRRREKERVEKARQELEKKEELRQRRKLEFLITQTELYSHFVGKRLKSMCYYIIFLA
jgi:hypothetical protein